VEDNHDRQVYDRVKIEHKDIALLEQKVERDEKQYKGSFKEKVPAPKTQHSTERMQHENKSKEYRQQLNMEQQSKKMYGDKKQYDNGSPERYEGEKYSNHQEYNPVEKDTTKKRKKRSKEVNVKKSKKNIEKIVRKIMAKKETHVGKNRVVRKLVKKKTAKTNKKTTKRVSKKKAKNLYSLRRNIK